MNNSLRLAGVIGGSILLASAAFADTPDLVVGHGHGVQVSGKVTMFRVQQKGIEVMVSGEKVDAEILVQVDTHPDTVYVMPMHDPDPAKQAIMETLRQAYVSDKLITIEHIIAPGKKVATINWVQFGTMAAK